MTENLYITKYALTGGIQVDECEVDGGIAKPLNDKWTYYHGEGKDWHRTWARALARAEEMRTNKLASLEKQAKRLRTLTFKETKMP